MSLCLQVRVGSSQNTVSLNMVTRSPLPVVTGTGNLVCFPGVRLSAPLLPSLTLPFLTPLLIEELEMFELLPAREWPFNPSLPGWNHHSDEIQMCLSRYPSVQLVIWILAWKWRFLALKLYSAFPTETPLFSCFNYSLGFKTMQLYNCISYSSVVLFKQCAEE